MSLLEPIARRPRPVQIKGWVVIGLLVLGIGGAVGWRLLGGSWRVAILSPRDGTLVASSFHVDVALSGTRRPASVEITMDGRVVGHAPVPADRWAEPGSAILTELVADVRQLPPGWYTMSVRLDGGPFSSVESTDVRVRVADASLLEPASAPEVEAVRAVFAGLLPKAIIALDQARRLDRTTWPQDGAWKAARDAVLAAPTPLEIREALGSLFTALEEDDDRAVVVAGDLLNLSLERRHVPYWATVNGSSYGDGRKETYVMTYALEEPVVLRVGGTPIEALAARRLDTLNVQELMLGHRTTGVARAVLLVDNIEDKARELSQCLGEPARDCSGRWASARIEYGADEDVLAGVVTAMQSELRAATGAACEDAGAPSCGTAMAALLRRAVAHHEVRHVVDHRRGIPLARGVRALLSDLRGQYHLRDKQDLKARLELERMSHNTVSGANHEASAYLAELAEGEGLRFFHALTLHAYACDRRYDGTNEAWAGRTIIAGLGAALGATDATLVTAAPDDDGWTGALAAIAALSADDLGRHAAALYAVEFGAYDAAAP
ncbi:MAG: hypothetical protein AMXMBFR64_03090 [Myxococcales bacterium]